MPTPIRNLRVPDHEWDAWKQRASEDGVTLTRWLRQLANREIAGPTFEPTAPPSDAVAARQVEPRFK